MNRLSRLFWVVLALLFLLEAWLWYRLQPMVARIVGAIPWGWIKPASIRLVDRLSPQATLVVFAIPFIALLPLKFLEFWFLVHRQWVAAIMLLVLAKLAGLGMTAFIFEVTKDKLLLMTWFRRVYEFFLWARDWAHERIAPITKPLREWSHQAIKPMIRHMRRWQQILRPRPVGRFFERLKRIRGRIQTARASVS